MEKALLLVEPAEISVAGRLEKVLAVFGVACHQLTVQEFLAFAGNCESASKFRLLSSSTAFLKLTAILQENSATASIWQKQIHSVFVFADSDLVSFKKLAGQIIGTSLVKINQGTEWNVSDTLPEFCKSMSGVRVVAASSGETALGFAESSPATEKIIFTKSGAAFVRHEFQSVPVFLSTANVIDVDAPLPGRTFDIRVHFLSAVPVVLYVRWAFVGTCWQPPETSACLVIDDPLLTPRYGFLNYQHLLNLMERVNFSTSIAFIPWNCNRSTRKIVRLFQENPKRFSLSIHGCDHTGGEFGSRNSGWLAWKSRLAMQRMARHQSRTGLPHDPVMVYPQGVFSGQAIAALKRVGFIGIVNSEVISTDPQPCTIKIADYWDMAVMNYSDFPIFTRRYPRAGVENFAFDILLGKPCLVVVHQNDCYDGCRHVAGFMGRLNQLNARLCWTNLAEVVQRGFRQREIFPGVVEVEMYGSAARIDNPSAVKKTFRIRKRESAPTTIREIHADTSTIKWNTAGNQIAFEVELDSGASKTVSIVFNEPASEGGVRESWRYRAKTMARRYLCEFRDNYVMRRSFSQ